MNNMFTSYCTDENNSSRSRYNKGICANVTVSFVLS